MIASKGFWTEMLGIGNFYYELAIQVVETCMILQEQTGGITGLDIIKKRIHRLRSKNTEEITEYFLRISNILLLSNSQYYYLSVMTLFVP